MNTSSLSVTEVVRAFSATVNRVAHGGERIVVLKHGKPVAELRPVPAAPSLGELEELLRSLPRLGPDEAASFAADLEVKR